MKLTPEDRELLDAVRDCLWDLMNEEQKNYGEDHPSAAFTRDVGARFEKLVARLCEGVEE